MISDATLVDLLFIASRLRERDLVELAATRGDVDPSHVAIDAYSSPWKYAAYGRDNTPCLAIGAKPMHNGVVNVWGFGTNKYKDGVVEMTNHLQTYMIPSLIDAGNRRAQCIVHPQNTASRSWLRKLGFYSEATLSRFGNGTDMLLYAWVLNEPSRDFD